MSSLYNLEPQPTAKCVLQTTAGEIELELFAKQTPLASRNFLQHILDGYYDQTGFHRLIPGFIIQGGDPTGTGHGGESIYPENNGVFADEFHSRLKYNRRGLLGMANGGTKDDNGSQFFLTLGATPELEGKNTLFGRVVGDTIYNLAKMGEAELEEGTDRPLYPIRVTGAEVLVNPFDGMAKRERKVAEPKQEKKVEKKRGTKKTGKTLLSFGADEEGEEDSEPVVKKAKFNTKLITATDTLAPMDVDKGPRPGPLERRAENVIRRLAPSPPPPPEAHPAVGTALPTRNSKPPTRSPSASPEPQVEKVTSLLDRTNAQITELKASMKRHIPAPLVKRKNKSALEQMIPETSIRGRKRKHGGGGSGTKDDQWALDMLQAFRAKLDAAPPEAKPATPSPPPENANNNDTKKATRDAGDDDEAVLCDLHFIANCLSCRNWLKHDADGGEKNEDDDEGWMSHALSFEKDRLGKDLSWKKKNEEELVVIDPREKSRTLKEEVRAKRESRRDGGSRAWDKDRRGENRRDEIVASGSGSKR